MKKVLAHGTAESLYEFLNSPFNRGYEVLALITDKPRKFNKNKVNNPAVENLEVVAPADLQKFFYKVIDGVLLTDNDSKQQMISKFALYGVEPKKIILWNNQGIPEFFNAKDQNGVNVLFMEGLQFHIKKPEDEKFFNEVRGHLHQQKHFYAINPKDYPAVVAKFYQQIHGKPLDWNNLKTFSEKMQWIKLFDSTPMKTRLADKFLVRSWIAEQIGEEYLIPLIGVWDNADEIDFDALPNQFVLKPNHGSGMNIICKDKTKLDIETTREKLDAYLAMDFGTKYFELHYDNIKKKIIANKFMENPGKNEITDYRFMCFEAKPVYCVVDTNHEVRPYSDWFDMDYKHQDFELAIWPNNPNPAELPKPENFELMKELATKLCKDFIHARADFFEVQGKLYFAEVTFIHWAGNNMFKTPGADEILGSHMTLPINKNF